MRDISFLEHRIVAVRLRVEDKRPGSRLCLSRLAPLEDRLAMLLKGVQARLESMKHRDGAIRLLSGLS